MNSLHSIFHLYSMDAVILTFTFLPKSVISIGTGLKK